MFFDNGMTRVSQDTVISIVLNSLDIREALIHRFPISDVEIKPNAIFPAEQAKRTGSFEDLDCSCTIPYS